MSYYERTLSALITASSACFAFFWLPYHRLFDLFSSILILIFLIQLLTPSNTKLRKDPFVHLATLFFTYLVITIAWHKFSFPVGTSRIADTRKYLRIFYFIPIAYAISYSRLLNPWRFLTIAFLGLILYLMISVDPVEWERAWSGHRVDFGIENAQHTGIIFATCFIAFTVFTVRLLNWSKKLPPIFYIVTLVIWFSALLFSLWVIFVSQTRAVWLGLSTTTLIMFLFFSINYIKQKRSKLISWKNTTALMAVIIVSILIGNSFNTQNLIVKRLSSEKTSIASLQQAASHEKKQMTSFEIRVASWAAAPEWILERPFMGWGRRGAKNLIKESEHFNENFKSRFGHLHNSYLESLVDLGLVGSGFIITLIFLLGHSINKNYKKGKIPKDVFYFSWAFFIFWLVVNIFESYIIFSSGTYLIAIVAAFSYSFIIKENISN